MDSRFDGLTWFGGLIRLTRIFFLFLNHFFQFHRLILILLRIKLYDLFCLLFIMLFWSHDPGIVLNELTQVDSRCFLCFFN